MDAVVAGMSVSLQWAVVTVIDYFLFLRSNLCFLEICRWKSFGSPCFLSISSSFALWAHQDPSRPRFWKACDEVSQCLPGFCTLALIRWPLRILRCGQSCPRTGPLRNNSDIQFVLIVEVLSGACITLLGSCARFWCCLCLPMLVPRTIATLLSACRQLPPRVF